MKLKYTKIKQRHILVCSDLKKEGVNRKELDILYEPPEGLLRVLDYDESKRVITYDVGCCIPLQSYYKQKCFTEDEVFLMVKQLLTILDNMEASRLTMQKLVLEFKYVFFDITHAMLRLVFCPVQNNYSPLESEQIFEFLKKLVINAVIVRDRSDKSDDKIQSFLLFLKKQQKFSAKAISLFFDDEYTEPVSQPEPSIELPSPSFTGSPSAYPKGNDILHDQRSSGFTPAAPDIPEKISKKQLTAPIDPLPSTIQKPVPISHTGFNTDQYQPSKPIHSAPMAAPGDTIDTSDDLGTGFMQPGDTLDTDEAAYIRNDITKIEYELPYGDCVIGRAGVDAYGNPVSPDLAVTENMRVSKFHARISYDGSNYYIADLTGKGRTRVNGQAIESGIDPVTREINGKKMHIKNGDKIQLASEGYTFIIKSSF